MQYIKIIVYYCNGYHYYLLSNNNYRITVEYSGTPPYDHLVITTTSFGPGNTSIHFLIKTPR